jgi:hypothetical protein
MDGQEKEAASARSEERGSRIAVFPRMPAMQFAPGKCVMCSAKGETPVTPVRFGDFWTGVVVPMCDRCLAYAADTLAATLDKQSAAAAERSQP